MRDAFLRILAIFLAITGLPAVAQVKQDLPVNEFFQSNCLDCHSADAPEGGFRIDQLSLKTPNRDQLARLVLLYDRVHAGEMPPKNADQPPPAERAAFLAELRTNLVAIEKKIADDAGGRSMVRRMNRVEYESTLRDLLGLPLLRVKDLLPEDGQQFGFDKVAGALDISHIQMSKYLQAADIALRQAVVRTPIAPETKTWREPAVMQGSAQGAIAVHCAVPLKGTSWLRSSRHTLSEILRRITATTIVRPLLRGKRTRLHYSPGLSVHISPRGCRSIASSPPCPDGIV